MSEFWIQLKIIRNFFTRKLDQTVIKKKERWAFYAALVLLFFLRMVWKQGYYAIAYLLGFYIVQNVLLFLTPLGLPTIEEEEEDNEIFDIPETIQISKNDDESKPIIRKLNEFHLWKKLAFWTCIAIFMTFFEIFDFPVFWPLLLIYFIFSILSLSVK